MFVKYDGCEKCNISGLSSTGALMSIAAADEGKVTSAGAVFAGSEAWRVT